MMAASARAPKPTVTMLRKPSRDTQMSQSDPADHAIAASAVLRPKRRDASQIAMTPRAIRTYADQATHLGNTIGGDFASPLADTLYAPLRRKIAVAGCGFSGEAKLPSRLLRARGRAEAGARGLPRSGRRAARGCR